MSGRVEETARPTVIALANDIASTLLVTAQQKRLILTELKTTHNHWSATQRHIYVFAHLVGLLTQAYLAKLQQIVIDPEYSGYEPIIKDRIVNYWRLSASANLPLVRFNFVGKKSPAHSLAIGVFRGEVQATKVISALEFFKTFP